LDNLTDGEKRVPGISNLAYPSTRFKRLLTRSDWSLRHIKILLQPIRGLQNTAADFARHALV